MKLPTQSAVIAMMLGAAAVCMAAPEDAPAPKAPILSTDLDGRDLAFFDGASHQTALVIRLSGLAVKHAVTPEVQQMAAAVGKEQAEAAGKLIALADQKHLPMAVEPDGQGRKQLDSIEKLAGAKFDKSYLNALGDAQDALAASLESGAASADKDIKQYAQTGIEILKQERERVKKLGM